MDNKQFEKDELDLFVKTKLSASDNENGPEAILKDLVQSKGKLAFIYLIGSLLGYILSLAICAQCAIGLSPLSWKLASFFHSIPDPWCPLLCGMIFGISPTLVTLFYLSRFQHRYLLFHIPWLPFLVPVLGSLFLFVSGDTHSWEWRRLWLCAALLTPYLVEIASAFLLKQAHWSNA